MNEALVEIKKIEKDPFGPTEIPPDPDDGPPRKTAAGRLPVPAIPKEELEPLDAYSKQRVA